MALISVAALQPPLDRLEPAENFAAVRRMVQDLVSTEPVDLIVLPEAFDGSAPEPDADEALRRVRADGRGFISDLAHSFRTHVVGGSVVWGETDASLRNVCFVADRSGRIVGEYAKRKLFANEVGRRTAGEAPGIFELGCVRVGVLICADLWYPELARELGGQVDILCVPAKTVVASKESVDYARELWWSLAVTRAVENVLPIIVADWCQRVHPNCLTAGASSLNDPSGRPHVDRLRRRIPDGGAGWLVGRIDLDAVRQIRQYRQAVGLLERDGQRT